MEERAGTRMCLSMGYPSLTPPSSKVLVRQRGGTRPPAFARELRAGSGLLMREVDSRAATSFLQRCARHRDFAREIGSATLRD